MLLCRVGSDARELRTKIIRRAYLHGWGGRAMIRKRVEFFVVGAPGGAPETPASFGGTFI